MKQNENGSHKYDDIIHLPHHVSKTHLQMPLYERAAQFSPFAALTGHADRIKETERLTENRIELDEYEVAVLDEKLQYIKSRLDDELQISITYFEPDERKAGGIYRNVSGKVKKIDEYSHRILFLDGTVIDIYQISDIEIIQ